MIFVSLGTQKFQLNRLLIEIDDLIKSGFIKEEVFAQIGNSTYIPLNYKYKKFLTQEEFETCIHKCKLFITHGGVGSICAGLKENKTTIVFPRLCKYNEHVDDHQLEISKKYEELGYILCVDEKTNLKECLFLSRKFISSYVYKKNDISNIIYEIEKYL